jgi:hypothetical protein
MPSPMSVESYRVATMSRYHDDSVAVLSPAVDLAREEPGQ